MREQLEANILCILTWLPLSQFHLSLSEMAKLSLSPLAGQPDFCLHFLVRLWLTIYYMAMCKATFWSWIGLSVISYIFRPYTVYGMADGHGTGKDSSIHEKTERSQASGSDLLTFLVSIWDLLSWCFALTILMTTPYSAMFLADCWRMMFLLSESSDRGVVSSPLGAMFLAVCANAILDLTGWTTVSVSSLGRRSRRFCV